jgi:hypothetical protein
MTTAIDRAAEGQGIRLGAVSYARCLCYNDAYGPYLHYTSRLRGDRRIVAWQRGR